MLTAIGFSEQIPLIHVVESDDRYFEEHPDLQWHKVLRDFRWREWRSMAAQYYEGLWRFNQAQADARVQRARSKPELNTETQKEATMRLLFERPTLDKNAALIEQASAENLDTIHVDPTEVAPGVPPIRLVGRSPKCFFAMFKAFFVMSIRGRPSEPEHVYEELTNNPSFARTCGFTMPKHDGTYRQSDIPSLRKLEQFDQIMTDYGLWDASALQQVRDNLDTGRVRFEATIVHDTTHFYAASSMQKVEIPAQVEAGTTPEMPAAPEPAATPVSSKEKPKKTKKKSQPKTTKNCRCEDREQCSHPWISADPGAGTVVKSKTKMYWGHKASTVGFPEQEVLLDAVAMTDAASHDSQSVIPHLERLKTRFPDFFEQVTTMLDDRAADDAELKQQVLEDFGIQLLVPINPRNRKPITENLPKGIDHITPLGRPVCSAGHTFDFVGCRHDFERFLFQAPLDENDRPVCDGCPLAGGCLRKGSEQRHLSIPFHKLPWIDPELPQLSRRFELRAAMRTAIERIHKLMKFDFGSDRLGKRGNRSFQALLDKTVLAMHMVIAYL